VPADPVIFLRGDVVEKRDTGIVAIESYIATTPYDVQALAEQLCAGFTRPFIHLARPGILGSSGHHLDRRRPREVALVDMALTRLKARRISAGIASILSVNQAVAISSQR
jgi:hypothetical protein